mmetsp:Transcript_26924/g.93444  ORF Transcript_26924/g.93444 Transcript_26924/m.93444 type:complete len:510 (-) Transcript_26924:2076-3605(-)
MQQARREQTHRQGATAGQSRRAACGEVASQAPGGRLANGARNGRKCALQDKREHDDAPVPVCDGAAARRVPRPRERQVLGVRRRRSLHTGAVLEVVVRANRALRDDAAGLSRVPRAVEATRIEQEDHRHGHDDRVDEAQPQRQPKRRDERDGRSGAAETKDLARRIWHASRIQACLRGSDSERDELLDGRRQRAAAHGTHKSNIRRDGEGDEDKRADQPPAVNTAWQTRPPGPLLARCCATRECRRPRCNAQADAGCVRGSCGRRTARNDDCRHGALTPTTLLDVIPHARKRPAQVRWAALVQARSLCVDGRCDSCNNGQGEGAPRRPRGMLQIQPHGSWYAAVQRHRVAVGTRCPRSKQHNHAHAQRHAAQGPLRQVGRALVGTRVHIFVEQHRRHVARDGVVSKHGQLRRAAYAGAVRRGGRRRVEGHQRRRVPGCWRDARERVDVEAKRRQQRRPRHLRRQRATDRAPARTQTVKAAKAALKARQHAVEQPIRAYVHVLEMPQRGQ